MKKLVVISSICIAVGGMILVGCSKSKSSASENNNSANNNPVATSAADNPVTLKIKWQAGKKYEMAMDFSQEMKMDLSPKPMNQQLKLTQDFEVSPVTNLDDGGWELQMQFGNQTMNIMQGDREILSFDSSQDPAQDTNNPAAPILRAMVGARLQYFTDANGKVEKVEGVDELKKRIAATVDPRQQAMFGQMFSEDTLKQYGSFSDSLPDHPVKIGDSWPFNRDISTAAGTMNVSMKYTFENWEQHDGHKCAHLEATGDISTKNTSTAMGAIIDVQKGKISGDVWFDPELGMIREADSDQNMTLKITTRARSFTQQLKQQIHFSLVDITP